MPSYRTRAALRLSLALLALAACSRARQIEGRAESAPCARCHGGEDNLTGAPPKGLRGEAATTDLGVGAHSMHVQAGPLAGAFPCTACHPDPRYGSTQHMNGTRDVAFGGLATTGLSSAPTWDRTAATCSNTYCHGQFTGGNAANAPVWTRVDGTQAACGTCHGTPPPAPHPAVDVGGGMGACNTCHPQTVDASGAIVAASAGGKHVNGQIDGGHNAAWMDPASPSFHAISADQGLASCQVCHGQNLDGVGVTGVACSSCHTAGGTAPALTCTGCHGGTENSTGAPPRARWADPADPVRIGAHTSHVSGSDLAPAFDCDVCHVKPASMFSPGHLDASPAEVTFGGLAIAGGATGASWDRATTTCSSTYCHGATLAGGQHTQPDWTKSGQGEAACGTCHGLPPPSPHPDVPGGTTQCNACHPNTVDASGHVIPPSAGGLHLDGTVEWSGGHPAEWMDPASPGFHAVAADQGLATCQLCHGTSLDGTGGMTTVACASCHATGGSAPVLSCTGCHGGTDNQTGAPPRPQWAYRADTTEAALRTGAHTAHVTGDSVVPAFDCDVCHTKPTSMLAAGHITTATSAAVTFAGLATTGLSSAPTWDRSSATCAVYCHGATLHGGSLTTPSWTGGASQATCGSCHGVPPPAPHPAVTGGTAACHDCHPQTIDASGALVPRASGGKHVDGHLDGGHLASWMDTTSPDFHAYSADRGLSTCQLCHGQNLDGVGGSTTVACADCHVAAGAAPPLTCTGCHGGTDNATGAPPKATWGNRTDAVRIGAHSAHVATNTVSAPIDCSECHVKPATPFDTGHLDGPRATVVFQGAVSGPTGGTWNYPLTGATTCASTWCHGNFTRGNTTNVPDWTGTNQAACGTCHPARPAAYLHQRHQREYVGVVSWWPQPGQSTWVTCDQCHSGIASSVDGTVPPALTLTNGVGPALHVNGETSVVFKLGGTYTKGATEGTCSGLACHPGETKYWPR